jgi:hypothetical protein
MTYVLHHVDFETGDIKWTTNKHAMLEILKAVNTKNTVV